MKVVVLYEFGDVNQLRYEDADQPPVGDKEVLVRVRATSINPVDWKIRSGAARSHMDIELPTILGRDLSGEVVQAGPGVVGFEKGMRVMGLANGTYAEFTTAKADVLSPIPDALSFEQAAALPLVTLTGAQLIERAVKPTAGQTVLVTGALGSVGRSAVHVARKHGCRVIVGVRAKEKEQAAALGGDQVVGIDDESEIVHLHELDAIADTVGGPTIARLLKSIRSGGVLGSVLGEPKEAKNYNIRVAAFMAEPDASRLYELADEAARGEFSIPIVKTMKLSEVREAQALAEKGGTGGKVILVP